MKKPQVISAAGWSYFPIAFAARFPYAMLVVGVLTLVVTSRGSVALGGLNSAAVGIGTAMCGPLIGNAADRYGQRRTLSIAAVLNSLAIVALVAIVTSVLPPVVILVSAFLVGATAPQVGPMSRTRLVHVVDTHYSGMQSLKVLNGVMAYESAVDEVVFVFGPVAVGLLAVVFSPVVAVLTAAVLTLACVLTFALHRSARTAVDVVSAEERAPVADLATPGLFAAAVGTLGLGFFFGSALTALTAHLDVIGEADSAGIVYGCLGVGSTILALSVPFFPEGFALRRRWIAFSAVMVVGGALFATVTSIPLLCVALVISGVGIGPTLVTIYSIGSRRAPRGATATTLTILGSAVVLGQSLASAVTGAISENLGVSAAMMVPLVAALVVVAGGVWNSRIPELESHPAEAVREVMADGLRQDDGAPVAR